MTQEREFGWDDTIVKDGGEFTLLPAGDYNFTVTKFDRSRFAGSAKMPACNQAKLEITVHSPVHGDVVIFHNLFLHTKTEGLLSNFFAGIGQKRKGEPLRMNWNAVVGARGRLKLVVNSFTGNDGTQKTNNDVKTFYEATTAQPPAPQSGYQAPQQPAYQQAPPAGYQPPANAAPFPGAGQPQTGGWAPGQF